MDPHVMDAFAGGLADGDTVQLPSPSARESKGARALLCLFDVPAPPLEKSVSASSFREPAPAAGPKQLCFDEVVDDTAAACSDSCFDSCSDSCSESSDGSLHLDAPPQWSSSSRGVKALFFSTVLSLAFSSAAALACSSSRSWGVGGSGARRPSAACGELGTRAPLFRARARASARASRRSAASSSKRLRTHLVHKYTHEAAWEHKISSLKFLSPFFFSKPWSISLNMR